MTVISSTKDAQALTLIFVAEFDASVERVWQLWADPRQLERWWGPPTYPATFVTHEVVSGSRSHYYMTSPEGEKMHGWWVVTAVDAPNSLEFDDGFADENGDPTGEHGATHAKVTLGELGDVTRVVIETKFETVEQLDEMVAMGMEEGMTLALGQIEDILAG